MTEFTIFDLLRSIESPVLGIDFFRCFESDVTMLRMFNAFRLDDRYVVPYNDPNDGFEALARQGILPPVVFVDPNFVDLPPIWMANDDHAPADLRHGQEFLARIFNALIDSPQWPNALLLITYDEHGGFFDHVPPPGTGPAEWVGAVPKLHPEGADYMGPRVPTLVISPWVGAGGEPRPPRDTTRRATPTRPADGDRRDFHASLSRMGLPRLRPR